MILKLNEVLFLDQSEQLIRQQLIIFILLKMINISLLNLREVISVREVKDNLINHFILIIILQSSLIWLHFI